MVRSLPGPLRRFLDTEAAGGIVLLVAAGVALVWANSPWQSSYDSLATTSVHHWVNDRLMALFFLVVGLEIKRELVHGELRDRRRAAVPALAAVGGMVVPALLYLVLNAGHEGQRGWGIPMATDIAFAVGIVTLLGRRVPPSLKVFLLTLAIVDDIGAIVVIAVFYAGGFGHVPLLIAAAAGLLTPARQVERMEAALHPWSSFLVVPLFALVNAGIPLGAGTSRVTLGVVVGLVLGKLIGISGATWLAGRAGLGGLPDGARWSQLLGVALVAGIGFTVSLFVADLAFTSAALRDQASIGILAASVLAAGAGAAVLTAVHD